MCPKVLQILYPPTTVSTRVDVQTTTQKDVDSVLALGYPAEQSVAEEYKDSVKYWKDESGSLHVPKRKLDKVVHHNKY